MLPETALDAVAAWNAGREIDAVAFVHGLQSEQQKAWAEVFEILNRWPGHLGRWTFSALQFDSWCFKGNLAWPAPDATAAEAARLEAIRGMAYAILREGFSSVIARKSAKGSRHIVIQKAA